MSKAHLPPVPPANRAPVGGSSNPRASGDPPGNIKENTTHQA